MVRLRALDVETSDDFKTLPERVSALQTETRALTALPDVAPNRVMRLSLLLERVQKSLMLTASKGDAAARGVVTKLVESIEEDVASIFETFPRRRKPLRLARLPGLRRPPAVPRQAG